MRERTQAEIHLARLRRLREHVIPIAQRESKARRLIWMSWGKQTRCRTQYCLGGLIAIQPEFVADGWRLTGPVENHYNITWTGPGGRRYADIAACMAYFGLGHGETLDLFGPYDEGGSLTKRIDRLDRLIEQRAAAIETEKTG